MQVRYSDGVYHVCPLAGELAGLEQTIGMFELLDLLQVCQPAAGQAAEAARKVQEFLQDLDRPAKRSSEGVSSELPADQVVSTISGAARAQADESRPSPAIHA